jgi:hypothetical protein
MVDPQPIPVISTHEIRQRSITVPAGTPGEITAMTGTAPTYYTVSFWLNGTGESVTVDRLTRMDLHEA